MLDALEADEDLAKQVRDAETEATEHVEEALYQAAVSGNVTACKLWLDLRRPSTSLVPTDGSDEPSFDQELAELNKLAAGK